MRIEAIFWVSLAICVVSFVLFAAQIVVRTVSGNAAPPGNGAGGAQVQTLNPAEAMRQMGALAESFGKAGPIATSAALAAFFGLLALLSSGVVTIQG